MRLSKGKANPKVTKELFEIRVTRGGIYRGFYAYLRGRYIVILHFFQKKTQKTPKSEIEKALKIKKEYETEK